LTSGHQRKALRATTLGERTGSAANDLSVQVLKCEWEGAALSGRTLVGPFGSSSVIVGIPRRRRPCRHRQSAPAGSRTVPGWRQAAFGYPFRRSIGGRRSAAMSAWWNVDSDFEKRSIM
jgi:hypothetical protein